MKALLSINITSLYIFTTLSSFIVWFFSVCRNIPI